MQGLVQLHKWLKRADPTSVIDFQLTALILCSKISVVVLDAMRVRLAFAQGWSNFQGLVAGVRANLLNLVLSDEFLINIMQPTHSIDPLFMNNNDLPSL